MCKETPRAASIQIDLAPYAVKVFKRKVVIEECRGSILRLLDNKESVTNYPGSESHCRLVLPETRRDVSFSFDEDDAVFTLVDGYHGNVKIDFDDVVKWIDVNFDGIESIGWELLRPD